MEKWTEAEDNAIRRYYGKYGPQWLGWAEVLPKRSNRAIQMRASRLDGIERPKVSSNRMVYIEGRLLEGAAPSQIDRDMSWKNGTTHDLIVAEWKYDKEHGR